MQQSVNDIQTHFIQRNPAVVARFARRMVDVGATHLVMEVSSHALALFRAEGIRFEVAAFTNLTQDHLDYHRTMDAYFAAKARFFEQVLPTDAPRVLNADDARVATLKGLTFSASGGRADVRATSARWASSSG